MGVSSSVLITLLGLFMVFILVVIPLAIYSQEKRAFLNVKLHIVVGYAIVWMLAGFYHVVCLVPAILFKSRESLRLEAVYRCKQLGRVSFRMFHGEPVIVGAENLPKEGQPAVYIANHQSMMDIAALFFVERDFAWISKNTVFMIPGPGWLMKLAQYISLKRTDKQSIKEMYASCKDNLKRGISLILFPQGTRKRNVVLPFKLGAFNIAASAEVPIVPMTVILPDDLWLGTSNGKVKVIIHPQVRGTDVEKMKEESYEAIIGALPKAK